MNIMKFNSCFRNLTLALCATGLLAVAACDRPTATRARTPGEELDDVALSGKVKAALTADSTKYPDIQVATSRGTVQLSGFADNSDQKSRAGDIAKNVAGVKDVENKITIKEEKKP